MAVTWPPLSVTPSLQLYCVGNGWNHLSALPAPVTVMAVIWFVAVRLAVDVGGLRVAPVHPIRRAERRQVHRAGAAGAGDRDVRARGQVDGHRQIMTGRHH